MISDETIRKAANAIATKEGITLCFPEDTIYGNNGPIRENRDVYLTRYEAFRFSRFLENAILESCRLSGEKIDEGFAK